MTVPNSGFVCVGKPSGWTSFDVVKFVRERWNVKQVGHTGTLDPLAEGILILCLGEARKLSSVFLELSKTYIATIRLGCATDTDDISGNVVSTADSSALEESEIICASKLFLGEIIQIPPKYSAVKIGGQRAYKKARKGSEFEIPPKTTMVHDFKIKSIALPEITVEISCSSGTYIRSIARDLGASLGVGGTLAKLLRISIGHLSLNDCHSIEALRKMEIPPFLNLDYALEFMGRHDICDHEANLMRKGVPLAHISLEIPPKLSGKKGGSILLMNDGFPVALIKNANGPNSEYNYLRVFSKWK